MMQQIWDEIGASPTRSSQQSSNIAQACGQGSNRLSNALETKHSLTEDEDVSFVLHAWTQDM